MTGPASKKKRPVLRLVLILALLLAALAADSRWRLVTQEYAVSSENLPAAFDGFRILQISDLHGDIFGRDNRRLLSAVKDARPDIIVITGDLIDAPNDLEAVGALLPRLAETAPCYYVTGNHEWACGALPELRALLAEAGVRVLDNDWCVLERGGAQILLAGVEDPNGWADSVQPPEFVAGVRASFPEAYLILLAHRNDWPEKYPSLPVDLIFSGHAHGGIVRLPGIGGLMGTDRLLFPHNTEGAIRQGSYTMLVSRGLGNVPGTFRLLNNPQLLVAVLEKNAGPS